MDNVFNLQRFLKLLAREINQLGFKMLAITGVTFGIFALSVLYSYIIEGDPFSFGYVAFALVLVIISPLIFNKKLGKISSVFDFMLPASTFEKFLAKWVICVVLVPLYIVLLLLVIGSLYLVMPGGLCVEGGTRMMNSLQSLSIENILFILAFQSFFFVGAYFFRTHVFLKACLSLIVYFVLFSLIFVISHKYILDVHGSATINMNLMTGAPVVITKGGVFSLFGEKSNLIIHTILNLVAPLGLWVVSFLKLREIEI